jgi:hypothetical protein
VFQEFFVDIDFPATLTRGDEVNFPVAVYNYLDTAQTVRVEMQTADWFTPLGGTGMDIDLGPGQVTGVRFPVHVDKVGLPTIPGLTGVAIEQNGPSFDAYEYDPATGKLLHTWGQNGGDLGRGDTGDIDPAKPGYEFWGGTSLGIVSVVDYTQIATGIPPANFRIWWDGDLLSENLDGNQISKWAYPGMPSGAFSGATLAGMVPGGNRPPLYGDMFGDWREDVGLVKYLR